MQFISFCCYLSNSNIIKHSTTWWVIFFFSTLFPSIDHPIPNIIYCVILRVRFLFEFFVLLLVVRSHQRYLLICTVRNTPLSALFFSDRLPKFVFTILWVTYDVILLFLLFSIAYILPFPSYCHWHSAHLFRSNIFRTVSTQCLRQVSAFLQAIMFMYAFDVITSSDTVE